MNRQRSKSYILGTFFFQAEDGIRDLVRSRGLGDVYKRQSANRANPDTNSENEVMKQVNCSRRSRKPGRVKYCCLLYTSDAADERSSVDLGGRRIIKKKTKQTNSSRRTLIHKNAHQ